MTPSQRAAIGELLHFAEFCAESKSNAVKAAGMFALRRAVEIATGKLAPIRVNDQDVADFLKWWDESPGLSNEEFRRDSKPS